MIVFANSEVLSDELNFIREFKTLGCDNTIGTSLWKMLNETTETYGDKGTTEDYQTDADEIIRTYGPKVNDAEESLLYENRNFDTTSAVYIISANTTITTADIFIAEFPRSIEYIKEYEQDYLLEFTLAQKNQNNTINTFLPVQKSHDVKSQLELLNYDLAALIGIEEFHNLTAPISPRLIFATGKNEMVAPLISAFNTEVTNLSEQQLFSSAKSYMVETYMDGETLESFIDEKNRYHSTIFTNEVANSDSHVWADHTLDTKLALNNYAIQYSWMDHFDDWRVAHLANHFYKPDFVFVEFKRRNMHTKYALEIEIGEFLSDLDNYSNQLGESLMNNQTTFAGTSAELKDKLAIAYCENFSGVTPTPPALPSRRRRRKAAPAPSCYVDKNAFEREIYNRNMFENDLNFNGEIFRFDLISRDFEKEFESFNDAICEQVTNKSEVTDIKHAIASTSHGLYQTTKFSNLITFFNESKSG